MKILGTWLAVACLATLKSVICSKILALMTVPSHSHHLWNSVYLNELAKRGHEITYLGVDEYKNKPKNIRHVFVENIYEIHDKINFTAITDMNPYLMVMAFDSWNDETARKLIAEDGFKKFMNIIKSEKFDLIVYDTTATAFLLGAVDLVGRPPILGITPFTIPSWSFDIAGSPYPIAYNCHFLLKYGREMTYLERINNAGLYVFSYLHRLFHLSVQESIKKEVFGSNLRHISEILDDINVNIVNGNWITDNPFPFTPSLKPIAGLHISPAKPLPKDIQEFLDSATSGAIFFSLGSNILSSLLQPEEVAILIKAFEQLAPIKVLWKWEKDELPGKPSNVKIGKWLPQNDILSHPNVRLFFTHGGMLSTQEALFHGVPIVGMPVFLDQHVNVRKMSVKGMGEGLRLDHLTAPAVVRTLRRVLENPSYKANAMAQSKIFRDYLNNPLDEAVYWTDYVIRHNGAKHLRPVSKDIYWFQSGFYDLLLTLAIVGLIALFVAYKIIRFIYTIYFELRGKSKRD